MAEALVNDTDPHPGQKVLDVACGSGTAALVAARRYSLEKIGEGESRNLLDDLKNVFERYNKATDGTAIVENTYLQTIIRV